MSHQKEEQYVLSDSLKFALDALTEELTKTFNQDTSRFKSFSLLSKNERLGSYKLNYKDLEEKIERNLNDKGIFLDFSFGVSNYRDSTSFFFMGGTKPISDTSSVLRSPYKIESNYFFPLTLKLYDIDSQLYKKISTNILMSLFLVLIVLFSLGYSIHFILKQKKVSEMKSDFMNNMTHELKTPLATISLASNTILEPSVIHNPDQVKRFIQVIKEENKTMNRQLELVLNAARNNHNKSDKGKSIVDLHNVLDDIVAKAELSISKLNGKLILKKQASETNVLGNEIQLYHIINNLVDNAIKYSDKSIEIEIGTFNKDGFIHLYISDKGIGIPKKAEPYIFDKFYRVPERNTHNVKGFGLGLNYARNVAKDHKGNIVYTRNKTGSTFTLILPTDKRKNEK